MNRSNGIADCEYPLPLRLLWRPDQGNAPARPRWSRATKNAQAKRALWVSGPLLDPLRVDIHVQVPRVPASREKLTSERVGEPSSVVNARVEAARERQHARFAAQDSRIVCNADMTPAEVRVFCKLDATGQSLMRAAMQQLQLSARAFHRVLKIARTIADLAGSDDIAPAHLAEAIHLRQAETARVISSLLALAQFLKTGNQVGSADVTRDLRPADCGRQNPTRRVPENLLVALNELKQQVA
jgi:Magnesium chelatase, subunit ChlI C-terminal